MITSAGKALRSILQSGSTWAITQVFQPVNHAQVKSMDSPYITYVLNQTAPHDSKSETSRVDDQFFILTLYAKDYDLLLSLGNAVRADLDRKIPGTYAGVKLDGIQLVNITDGDYDEHTRLFDMELEFKVRVKP
jgi:hypothetical protein